MLSCNPKFIGAPVLYHLFMVIAILYFADGTHVILKTEVPTQVACIQVAKDQNANAERNIAEQAPFANKGERVGGYLIECHHFTVPSVRN